jgi:hypothetical protein
MSHICANDEYRSQVGATNRPENIVIRCVSVVSLLYLFKFGSTSSTFSVFIYGFFTGLSLRLRADISKVTAHERIQRLYQRISEIMTGAPCLPDQITTTSVTIHTSRFIKKIDRHTLWCRFFVIFIVK